jgi:type II secretory pathway pseudopilin PulG
MAIKAKQVAGTAAGRRGQRGASLVEVLVVLVILLIGVFSAIRIFPIGLLGLRQAESRTLASRLATQMMEQIKSGDANLPQGVLFTTYDNGGPIVDGGVDPDDLGGYQPDRYPYNPYFADVNKFRKIIGESVKVPLPTADNPGSGSPYTSSGSLYTIQFGPIYMDPAFGNPTVVPANSQAASEFLRVYGAPLYGIPTDASRENAGNRLRGPQTYLIDYGEDGNAQIMFFPRRPRGSRTSNEREFRITFSYEVDGEVVSVPPFTIIVADDDEPSWQPIQDRNTDTTYGNIFEGSETVNREFNRIPVEPNNPNNWDEDDPYEYKLLSANVPGQGATPTYANVGALAFNPAGANYSDRGPFGQQAFTAYMDYSVLDWHIIREDREVPSVLAAQGAIPIKLTLNFIKRYGDVEPDQTTYRGLYRGQASRADIEVFDLQGTVPGVNPGEPLVRGSFGDRNAHYWVNTDERDGSYRTGTIYINSDPANPGYVPRGTQLRILYKAEGDWAMSVQKAFASYEPAFNENGFLPRPTSFDNYGKDENRYRLYFNRSDLNKSVVATLQYTQNNGEVVRTQPIQLTINQVDNDDLDQQGNPQYAYVNIRDYLTDGTTNWDVFGDIKGVSLKVRVIWKDNASTSNAWRIQDLDTYITRGDGFLGSLRRSE